MTAEDGLEETALTVKMVIIFLGGKRSLQGLEFMGRLLMAANVLGVVRLKLCIYSVWFSVSVFYFTIFFKRVLKQFYWFWASVDCHLPWLTVALYLPRSQPHRVAI